MYEMCAQKNKNKNKITYSFTYTKNNKNKAKDPELSPLSSKTALSCSFF